MLPNVSGGGAARVASILCNEWVCSGYEIHFITFETPGTDPIYPLHSDIVRHQLGLSISPRGILGFIENNVRRVFRLRATLKKLQPAAVIAFLAEANVTSVLAARSLGIPVLISERNHPAHHQTSGRSAIVRRIIYPFATRLCVQTEDIRAWFQDNLGIEATVIPNPVQCADDYGAEFDVRCRRISDRKIAVSLGRLEPQKGFDILIEAFASIASKVPDWDIVIHGEGSARACLESQIESFGLSGRIFLPGATLTPMQKLSSADLYVHPARYEGFPNALLEALSAGLCVVATDSPGASAEILQGGRYGMLVPIADPVALSAAMLQLMQDENARAAFAAKSREAVRSLSPAEIAARWLSEVITLKNVRLARPSNLNE